MPQEADLGATDIVSVEKWRRKVLLEAGYPQEEAFLLAGRFDIDVHVACDLLAGGCPVWTAIRILT